MHARIKATAGIALVFIISGCVAQPEIVESEKAGRVVELLPQTSSSPVSTDESASISSAPQPETEEITEPAEAVEAKPKAPSKKEDFDGDAEAISVVEEQEADVQEEAPAEPSIAELAYAQVSAFADGSSVAPEDTVVASPNLPSFHIESLMLMTSKAMSMFDEQYDLPDNYKIIAFTDSDFDWADQKLVEYNGQLPDGSWSKAFVNTNQSPDRCWMAIASNGNTHFCMSVDTKIAQQQVNTTAHEYFHIIQMGPIGLKPLITPVWITEGGAEYFGWAISERGSGYTLNKLAGWQTRYLSTTFGGSGYRDYLKSMTRNEFVMAMQSLEGGSLDSATRESHYKFDMYKLGAAANEYLIGVYSYDTYMNFLESIGNGGVPWSSAFVNSFGINPEEFYSALYDYLKNAIIK